jgi:TolB-like protein
MSTHLRNRSDWKGRLTLRFVPIGVAALSTVMLNGPSVSSQVPRRGPSGSADTRAVYLTDSYPTKGVWKVVRNLKVRGRRFQTAGVVDLNTYPTLVVYDKPDGYNFLEIWVAAEGGEAKGTHPAGVVFKVWSGSSCLYRSLLLTKSDEPVRLVLKVTGKEVRLEPVPSNLVSSNKGTVVWGEPRFLVKDPGPFESRDEPPDEPPDVRTAGGTGGGSGEGTGGGTGGGKVVQPPISEPSGTKIVSVGQSNLRSLAGAIKADIDGTLDLGAKPTLAIATLRLISLPGHELAEANAENLREDLTTALLSTKTFTGVERAQLDKGLEELKINQKDLFDSDQIQKLGKLVQARLVLIGSLSDRGENAVVNVRVLDTQTGKVVSAASCSTADTRAPLPE